MNTTTKHESIVYMLELDTKKSTNGYIEYADRKGNFVLQAQTSNPSAGLPAFELTSGDILPFNTDRSGNRVILTFTDNKGSLVPFMEVLDISEEILGFRVGDPDTVTVTVVYEEIPIQVE